MITREHYLHPKLKWDIINQARRNNDYRLQALKHIRETLQLNFAEVKEFLDSADLYIDPRLGIREPTQAERLHEALRTIQDLEATVIELQRDLAVAVAEKDVYKTQVYQLMDLRKE